MYDIIAVRSRAANQVYFFRTAFYELFLLHTQTHIDICHNQPCSLRIERNDTVIGLRFNFTNEFLMYADAPAHSRSINVHKTTHLLKLSTALRNGK